MTGKPFGNYWDQGSFKAIVAAIFVYVIGMLLYVTSKRNYMPGKEYGSAVLANPKAISKRFQDKDGSLNRVLSENVKISINTRKTRINNNVLVIGGAGSGKTLFLVKPNLMQMNTSFIIIQNLAQIKALFKDTWETIPGNCDALLYLGGNEQSTHKYVSESLGKGTIDKRSSGETKGRNGSSSRNYDVLGRELLTPDETRKLDNKKCILFIRGCDPIIDNKFNTFAHPLFKESEDGGALPYIHDIREGKRKIKPVGRKSWDYYNKCKKNGDAVFTAEVSLEELLDLEEEMPEKLFSEKELKNNRSQLKASNAQPKMPEKEVFSETGKEELLWKKLQKEDFTTDQLEQVRLGLQDGLKISQVLEYLYPEWSAEQMAEKRKELKTA